MEAEFKDSLFQLVKFQTEQSVALQKQQTEQNIALHKQQAEQNLELQRKQFEIEENFKRELLNQQKAADTREENFQERLLQQQRHFEELLMKTQEEQRKFLEATQLTKAYENHNAFSQTAVWSTVENFNYNPENGVTFAHFYRRYEDIFLSDCSSWPDPKRVRFLLRKLGAAEHTKFVNFILPKKTSELNFQETVTLLTELFSTKTSLFHRRYKCMNVTRREEDDYTTYASIVNKHCDDFKLEELSADNFKCLIFVQGLVLNKDSEIRRRVLNKLESEQNLTLQNLAEDCERFVALKQDSRDIEENGVSHIKKLHQKKKFTSNNNQKKKHGKDPPGPCWRCGDNHWYNECPYKFKQCDNCHQKGHKASHCRKKSGRKKTSIKLAKIEPEEQNIRKYVQVKMFKKKVRLQLDSGSDISIINVQTWKKLGRPTMIKSRKTARSVSGEKITFEGEILTNISFQNKTEKTKIFVMRKSSNLFGTDLIEKFRLWDLPLSSFCQKVEDSNVEAEKLKRELKENFPDVFSGGLGRCKKAVAKFQVKANEQPVFRKKKKCSIRRYRTNRR